MLTHRVYEEYVGIFAEMDDEDARLTEAGWIIENTDLSKSGIGTQLDDWQIFNLNNTARYQVFVKSRQVGFSFNQSLKKLARCGLKPGYKGLFISIDRAESQEKLRYMNAAWETLSDDLKQGPLFRIKNNSIMVEYRNKARCLSFPSKSPRGQSESDLTFDEVAHVRNAAEKYNGATAVAIRSTETSIELGSSPLSAAGFFFEVVTDPEKIYKSFDNQRFYVHWWDSSGLCANPFKARREAERDNWDLSENRDEVEYRINKYGTEQLKDEFYSRSTEQFRQEYECAFASDNSALIAIKYLKDAADTSLDYLIYNDSSEENTNKPWYLVEVSEEYVKEIVVPKIEEWLYKVEGETSVYVGFDPASSQHQSVITFGVGTRDSSDKFRIKVLGRLVFKKTPIYIQEHVLDMLAYHPATGKVCIDRTGHAIDLCDRLIAKYGDNSVFVPFNFSAKVKSDIGSRMQFYFEQGVVWYPYDKDLINQVYALKRITTRTGQESVQAPESKDHHADGGWSLGLMLYHLPVPEIKRETKVMTTNQMPRESYREREEYLRRMETDLKMERAGMMGLRDTYWDTNDYDDF